MKNKKAWFLVFGVLIFCNSCSTNTDETLIDAKQPSDVVNKLDSNEAEDASTFSFKTDHTPTLEIIPLDIIDNKLQYDFYKTEMLTGSMEYMSLEVLISIPRGYNKEIVKLESPVFAEANPSFLHLFQNIEFESKEELEKGIEEISTLFKAITHNSAIKEISRNQEAFRNELWHNDRPWRQLKFEISGHTLLKVVILKPEI